MLPKSYLKVIAACVIYESTLSKNAKIQALRFIENEASEMQLKVFINEGKICQVSESEVIQDAVFIPAMVIAAALGVAKVAYAQFLSKAATACVGKKFVEKQKCMRDYRIKANAVKISALKREMSKCNQTNNVKKCQNIFLKHINRIEKQIQKDKIKDIRR